MAKNAKREARRPVHHQPAHFTEAADLSGPWIEVDLEAIARNVERIRRWCGVPLMPVIKANAYGHGLVPVARRLARSADVAGFCVGSVREAVALRRAGVTTPVLNLGPFTPSEAERIVALDIAQSVFSGAVDLLDRAAAAQDRKAAVHVKIDTGLGRVGATPAEAPGLIASVAKLEGVRIAGVFTTLCEDPEADRIQIRRFNEALKAAAALGIQTGTRHAASSAAILEDADLALDMVRPGITVFGHYPSAEARRQRRIDLEPALTFKARVACVKTLRAGDPAGYHRAYRAPGPETLVTGAVGYVDGYPVQMAGSGHCLVGGRRHPVVGSVTANHICIRSQGGDIREGDEIVLYGRQGWHAIELHDVAESTGRSVYHLLSRLNPDLPRLYRD